MRVPDTFQTLLVFVSFLVVAMIGGLQQLSRRPGMPCPKVIRRLINQNPDFPVIETGKRGRAYQFDLDESVAFIERLQARGGMSAARWDAAMSSLGLDIDPTAPQIDQRHPVTREPP
ncbi:hypothetical protein [Sphingorhabdus lacus]|uniref:Uncharacterized protein n=1 Tax=Sphingorhabdus lacus TaxID=392610 RepID=A0A6I6L7C6_9SPHN|nr:hypothetical protein [Sphingorhabdus lacus]QGY81769.1 hypothetical protein EUU25_14765 [Sphingorhabdus lacus]